MKGIKVLKYFNLKIKFYFQFKLLTNLNSLKLKGNVYFHRQVTFPAEQILFSDSKFDLSLIIKNDVVF